MGGMYGVRIGSSGPFESQWGGKGNGAGPMGFREPSLCSSSPRWGFGAPLVPKMSLLGVNLQQGSGVSLGAMKSPNPSPDPKS